MVNQPYPFSVPAVDLESTNLVYTWDFDRDTDSDGDGITSNDNEGVGPTVVHPFSDTGVFWVVCIIENDEGLTTEAEILVTVVSSDSDSGGIDWLSLIQIIAVVIIILGTIGFVTLRILENRKIAAMLADQEEQEVEKEVVPPSVDEQKAMWGGSGINGVTPLSQPSTNSNLSGYSSGMSGLPTPPPSGVPTTPSPIEMDPDLAELISSSPPPTSAPVNNQVSDLLSAFTEDDAVEFEDVEDSEKIWKPSEAPLSGINPPVPEIVEAPEPESEPELEPEPEPVRNDRIVRPACSNCGQLFEVDMPVGVDIARTSCPHCQSVETIRFE